MKNMEAPFPILVPSSGFTIRLICKLWTMFKDIIAAYIRIIPMHILGRELQRMINNYESYRVLKVEQGSAYVFCYQYDRFYEA